MFRVLFGAGDQGALATPKRIRSKKEDHTQFCMLRVPFRCIATPRRSPSDTSCLSVARWLLSPSKPPSFYEFGAWCAFGI